MALLSVRQLSVGFRGPWLLDHVDCQIESGQRVGLLGRNGCGKTTFLRVLSGSVEPDSGDVDLTPGSKISLLPQEIPRRLTGSVFDVVKHGFSVSNPGTDAAWKDEHRVERILSQMKLDGSARFESFSAGMKRRVLLAQSLATEPDLLLLDEPTNHLDIESIGWLEDFLLRLKTTLVFVTHDRVFLRKLATRILEIDRGHLFDWSCDYDTFLKRKEASLEAEEKQNALFDKKLAQEEVWIRQGIKARRTRNEGRVRALETMRRERRERRSAEANVRMQIQGAQRSGNKIIEAKDVSFAYGDSEVVRDFSTTIIRRDKVGLVGPNGAGKTTLLRILLGQLTPSSGSVRLGTNLQIAYFDQQREQLDENATVHENVGHGKEHVQVGGRPQHVIGYLQNFLFSAERARTPIRFLSGGERNRVLLARLFAQPANVIVLDEPTNDLDTETLELLEARLVEFEGTILMVSHDRAILNNVVTSTIVFEEGGINEYDGGYDDWLRQRPEPSTPESKPTRNASKSRSQSQKTSLSNAASAATDLRPENEPSGSGTGSTPRSPAAEKATRRLTYNDQRELSRLPSLIEKLELKISELHAEMALPEYYQQSGEVIATTQARLKELEEQLAASYGRWEELDP